MIHPLRITRQAELLGISRGTVYYLPQPGTSKRNPGHTIYPYLLRGLAITRANQVWALDTTYIPMVKGLDYLTAAIDVASRRALAWKIANTLEACHAVDVLEEAFTRYSTPEIVNIDQGSQFTATMFVDAVKVRGCQISMDGRGAWRDNVFIERLWRTLKYEEVYLHAYDSIAQARHGIDRGLNWYTTGRSGRTRSLLYQVADHAEAHRSSTAAGAKLFIVD